MVLLGGFRYVRKVLRTMKGQKEAYEYAQVLRKTRGCDNPVFCMGITSKLPKAEEFTAWRLR